VSRELVNLRCKRAGQRTTNEEIGGIGGSYASRTLPGDLTLALEVGPTEAEYGTTVGGGPIVGYSDAQCVYDKGLADQLMSVATELDLSPQAAVLGAFESDASHAKASGLSPRAGLLCLPTLSMAMKSFAATRSRK
jgi:putative aminopeptidase FrvX